MLNALTTIHLSRPEGEIEVDPLAEGRFRVSLLPRDPKLSLPRQSCETGLPPELIQLIGEKTEYAWLCDSIARHESPEYVQAILRRQLFSYFPEAAFRRKRLLDFGCGSGASSFAMAAMLPETEVVGVELNGALVEIASRIAEFRSLRNVRFLQSPDPTDLPPAAGTFDFVMLCAVYEHLLPEERKHLMPKLWSVLKPGGVVFVNQTPHRYFPYEHHSTGLWLINYLPDGLAYLLARKFSRPSHLHSQKWEDLLRGGIRGGTERGILRHLCGNRKTATILWPQQNGLRDRADYWLSGTAPGRYRCTKRAVAALFRLSDRFLGTLPSMNVDVVIRKEICTPALQELAEGRAAAASSTEGENA
ncbi:MAG: methyltransferase domain-containing protein [Acidobacteria bacterium]|nr:methyltransferase domain-containing protein [Acidobacteriota bacterium]